MPRLHKVGVCALAALAVSSFTLAAPSQRQSAGAAPPQDSRSVQTTQPPDVAALNAALRVTDNAKRFPALQQVIDDYPNTAVAAVARRQLATLLAASLKTDARALQAYLAKDLSTSKDPEEYRQLASGLLDADIFLEDAERTARQGLAIDEQAFVAAETSRAKRSGTPIVRTIRDGLPYYAEAIVIPREDGKTAAEASDADLHERFTSAHLSLLSTFGQILAKRGRTTEAVETLQEVWRSTLPSTMRRSAATTLADLASRAGDATGEIGWRASAYVCTGGASPAARGTLEALYRKAHGGSLDGLEDLLDEQYRKSINPVKTTAYRRPRTRNARLVLAELFTGAACPPCVGADFAFDAALERFSRDDLALLVYHQHIPGPDPMTNPAGEARAAVFSVHGVPTFAIDGRGQVGGGSADEAAEMFANGISPDIERALATPPEARLRLKAKVTGATISVDAAVSGVKSQSRKLRLQIALVEEVQRYSGPNGVRLHPMVVRSLAGADYKGFPMSAAGARVRHVFDLQKIVATNRAAIDDFLGKPFRGGDKPTFTDGRKEEIDRGRLLVVAFVQDENPAQDAALKPRPGEERPFLRHVLQAACVRVGSRKTTN